MNLPPAIPRRRFVKLLAVSAAALAASPDPTLAAAAPPKRRRAAMPAAPANAALQKELANERKSVSDMLKVIRAFPLPAGSPPAMVFRPMKGTRGRRS